MLSDEEEEDDEVGEVLTLPLQAHRAMEKMEEFVHKVNRFFPPFDKHIGSNKRLSFKTSMNISLHNERLTPCWDPLTHSYRFVWIKATAGADGKMPKTLFQYKR